MASIRIHEDQENIKPEVRQKQSIMAVQPKRSVLAILDGNKGIQKNNALKGKQPASNCVQSKNNVNNENDYQKENRKNLVNPIVPVAQFEAFKVYEDNAYEERLARIDQKLRLKSTSQIYKGTAADRFYTKTEVAELQRKQRETMGVAEEKKTKPFEEHLSPIPMLTTLDNSFDDSMQLAHDVILKTSKKSKDIFFELEEYRADIYKYLREHELRHRPKAGYMKKQPDVTSNMRTILIDWLVEVAAEYNLHNETLYLSVNFIDRFLSYMSVVRGKLQLVGTAAMFLASKYEEIFPPDIGEFVYITDDTYNKRQVIRMEHLILKVLGFDLSVPTPLCFITAMCVSTKITEKTMYLAMYLCELSLLNGDVYLEYLPSVLAASGIALGRHILGESAWSQELIENTGYELNQLKSCIEFLDSMFKLAPTYPQHAIQNKYKSQQYMFVSQLKPRETPIDFN